MKSYKVHYQLKATATTQIGGKETVLFDIDAKIAKSKILGLLKAIKKQHRKLDSSSRYDLINLVVDIKQLQTNIL